MHTMKLQPVHFDYIKNGTKRIELRLYDEKRSKIKLDDIVEFSKEPGNIIKFKVRVTELLRYPTFTDLINDYETSILIDASLTKEDLINEVQKFYTLEDQIKYGVIGIKFELI